MKQKVTLCSKCKKRKAVAWFNKQFVCKKCFMFLKIKDDPRKISRFYKQNTGDFSQ